MNDTTLDQMIFEEMRTIYWAVGDKDLSGTVINDAAMTSAMTMNEDLKSAYGIMFSAADLARIAAAGCAQPLYGCIRAWIPEVKGDPMYPDYPEQVMEMDEAVYRFHQMVHYASTYGMESVFGIEVPRGWLPPAEKTPKTKKDRALLPYRLCSFIPVAAISDGYADVVRKILAKRERMTLPEQKIVQLCAPYLAPDDWKSVSVRFKENLEWIFCYCAQDMEPAAALPILRSLCQHTGDVLKCTKSFLKQNRWHLRTSQKRLIVRLLESYPAEDLENNVILSLKHREQTIRILDRLDCMKYARDPELIHTVDRLKDKKLHSWMAGLHQRVDRLKKAPAASKKDASRDLLAYASKRPGMLLRMAGWLIDAGADPKALEKALADNAAVLSTQTLVQNASLFGTPSFSGAKPEARRKEILEDLFMTVLRARMETMDTPLRGHSVYIDPEGYDLAHSTIETNGKSEEGGYVRSGIAWHIPEDVQNIRFFTYWNDKKRIDIDLHAYLSHVDQRGWEHIGWDGCYCLSDGTVEGVMSGDMTHSDAAEYIDICMDSKTIRETSLKIDCYNKVPFKNIDTFLTGLMAVGKLGLAKDVSLYDPKNCFFSHHPSGDQTTMQYGYINIPERYIRFVGKPCDTAGRPPVDSFTGDLPELTVERYIRMLTEAQSAVICTDRKKADVILKLGKPGTEKEISLLDNNFFMES